MTTILPVNKEALNNEYFKKSPNYDIQNQSRIISSKQLNNLQIQRQNTKNKKELNNLSANYIQEILINNKDIEETLNKFSADWAKL